jgi:hypothetical protein
VQDRNKQRDLYDDPAAQARFNGSNSTAESHSTENVSNTSGNSMGENPIDTSGSGDANKKRKFLRGVNSERQGGQEGGSNQASGAGGGSGGSARDGSNLAASREGADGTVYNTSKGASGHLTHSVLLEALQRMEKLSVDVATLQRENAGLHADIAELDRVRVMTWHPQGSLVLLVAVCL